LQTELLKQESRLGVAVYIIPLSVFSDMGKVAIGCKMDLWRGSVVGQKRPVNKRGCCVTMSLIVGKAADIVAPVRY